MSSLDGAREALRRHFGFEDFREGQDEVIAAILAGRDALVVMPTGGGKSLCYQLPAVLRPGTTLVVSPLIALMKDQVDALVERGIAATFINSSVSETELRNRLAGVRNGEYRLVYVAPERFKSDRFNRALAESGAAMLAIDEAHCISEWGHDFRPDYRRLGEAARQMGRPQIIALTATATPDVRTDIAAQLGLSDAPHFISGFDRPNLRLSVVHTTTEREKIARIADLASRAGGTGIVYAATRKSVESIAAALGRSGLSVGCYHAGLSDRDRTTAQDSFMSGSTDVIVATNAFGMGIDKADIRFVAHAQIPGSLEAYYQEIGRAGRDGLEAECLLLFNYADTRFQQFFIDGSFPAPDLIIRVYESIAALGSETHELPAREIASSLGLKNDMAVNSALLALERAGHISRLRGGERGVRMLDAEPATMLRIDRNALGRRAAAEQRKLRRMIDYAYNKGCFRRFILGYFGDRRADADCRMCSGCTGSAPINLSNMDEPRGRRGELRLRTPRGGDQLGRMIRDAAPTGDALREHLRETARSREDRKAREVRIDRLEPEAARTALSDADRVVVVKVLSCIARARGRYGKGVVAAVLKGSRARNIVEAGLDKLSTYGLLPQLTREEIIAWCDALIEAGCIVSSGGAYPTISLTEHGVAVMKGQEEARLRSHPAR